MFFLKRILLMLLPMTFTTINKTGLLLAFWGRNFKKVNLPLKIAVFIYGCIQLLGCLLLGQQSEQPGVDTNLGSELR